ncbi:MAG: DNA-binding transcriptional LysR family regulator [Myxococcota bacterium]|jgi:DNA-binding transcriptional LysR family regulator
MALDIRGRGTSSTGLLERGEADLVLHPTASLPAWVGSMPLYRDGFVCVVRADHPRIGAELTLQAYLAVRDVCVTPEGFGQSPVDRLLEGRGVARDAAVFVASFAMAPEIVAATDAILTLPARLAHVIAPRMGLRILAPPSAIASFGIDVMWHRGRDDPGLAWVREQLKAVAEERFERL